MSEEYLDGNWKAGWAIGLHTIKSIPLEGGGFDTAYTEVGETLNRLKYHDDFSQIPVLSKMAIDFLKTRMVTQYLDVIIPVPPSNFDRPRQPVFEIAKIVSKDLNIQFDDNYIEKIKETNQLKNIEDTEERKQLLNKAFKIQDLRYSEKKILLFDDLYRSGTTLNEITKILYNDAKVQNVYVLTLTKTRVKR